MNSRMYPPYTKIQADRVLLISPFWKEWIVGDERYDIANDELMICLVSHLALEVMVDPHYAGPELESSDPKTLGISAKFWGAQKDNWEAKVKK